LPWGEPLPYSSAEILLSAHNRTASLLNPRLADQLQFSSAFRVRLGIGHFETLEHVEENLGNCPPGILPENKPELGVTSPRELNFYNVDGDAGFFRVIGQ
jgi:hypothetical protein